MVCINLRRNSSCVHYIISKLLVNEYFLKTRVLNAWPLRSESSLLATVT